MIFTKAPYTATTDCYTAYLNGKDKNCGYVVVAPTIPEGSRLNIAAYGPDGKRVAGQSFMRDKTISADEQVSEIASAFFRSQKAFWDGLAASEISIAN